MNRQEVVVTIAKINRFIKQIAYWCELRQPIMLEHFDPEIHKVDIWGNEVLDYLVCNESSTVADMFLKGCKPDLLEEYLDAMGESLPKEIYDSFLRLSQIMPLLHSRCEQIISTSKGEFATLPDKLANKNAVELLKRAVDADLLTAQFQPTPLVNQPQLKLIAYGISKILNFANRYRYAYFNQLWRRIGYDLASVRFPRYKDCHCQDIIDLYPEVDFSPLFQEPQNLSFKTSYDTIKLMKLYHDLKDFGYISLKTSAKKFMGIFEGHKFIEPVCWTREQVLLGHFVKQAFGDENKNNLWIKTSCCFLVRGERPHPSSITTSLYRIKLEGRMKSMCAELSEICQNLND